MYGDEHRKGVAGTVFTNESQSPADEHFQKYSKVSKSYYVVKLARRATEPNDVTMPYGTNNPSGSAYVVEDDNQDLFVVTRLIYSNQNVFESKNQGGFISL